MFLLALATVLAGVFFGAAAAVEEFGPSYRRGAVMQGGLSAVGCALGLAAAWQLHDVHTAIGAVLLGLPIPVTLLFIGPINAQLLGSGADRSEAQTLELLARWSRRHWIRTALGGSAFLLLMLRVIA